MSFNNTRQDQQDRQTHPWHLQQHQRHSKHIPPTGLYDRYRLPQGITHTYKAAGVIPYKYSECFTADGSSSTQTDIFLCKQDCRSNDRSWHLRWNDFGGKIEDHDRGPYQTAMREFEEETQFCFPSIKMNWRKCSKPAEPN